MVAGRGPGRQSEEDLLVEDVDESLVFDEDELDEDSDDGAADEDEDSDLSEDEPADFDAPPAARLFPERESVMYQPLPLKTMPTG